MKNKYKKYKKQRKFTTIPKWACSEYERISKREGSPGYMRRLVLEDLSKRSKKIRDEYNIDLRRGR